MKYNIERIFIAGLKTPQLYIRGWVHAENYILNIEVDGEIISKVQGFIYRPDIAKQFREYSNLKTRMNLYGFYKEVGVSKKTHKIRLLVEEQGKQKVIFEKTITPVSRWLFTVAKKSLDLLRNIKRAFQKKKFLLQFTHCPRGLFDRKVYKLVKELHPGCTPKPLLHLASLEEYDFWINHFETFHRFKKLKYQPKISIIIPVYNPPKDVFDECIQSVLNQTYQNFEICLADDCSPNPEVKEMLENYTKQDKRIKVIYRKKNGGISEASNSALKAATGDFVALLDNDDTLSPHALYENVYVLNQNKDLDFLYSDEDHLNLVGDRCNAHLKSDWAPDTLMSYNYITHLAVIRKTTMDKVGGFRTKYNGAQDYDLFLRLTEIIPWDHIYHIPKILYHWRMSETSTALSTDAKTYTVTAGKNALEDTLKRRQIKGDVEVYNRTIYRVNYTPDKKDLVTIIIPTKNNYKMLRRCLKSIKDNTKHKYEVIIVSNNTDDPQAIKYLKSIKDKAISILTINEPFNFSMLNNRAVEQAKGEYVLFMNDDTKVITDRWIEKMLGYAEREHIGAVGPKLLFSDGKIQHVGVLTGVGYVDGPGHPFVMSPGDEPGLSYRAQVPHNYTAVTGACLMVKKSKFIECGGFDEKFPNNYNDIDLCIALREKGYYNICIPQVRLYHYESISRNVKNYKGYKDLSNSLERIHYKWGMKTFTRDPFYNPNYTRVVPYTLSIERQKDE